MRVFVILIMVVFLNAIEYGIEYNNPYYMDVNATLSLSNDEIEVISQKNEFLLYKELLMNSLIPKFLYLEASWYAMPTAGVAWKSFHQDSYEYMTFMMLI